MKKRFVYEFTELDIINPPVPDRVSFYVTKDISDIKYGHDQFLASRLNRVRFNKRMKNHHVSLVIAFDQSSYEIVGHQYCIHAINRMLWHDSFPILERTGFLFDGYVVEGFRRRGVFSYLHFLSCLHLFEEEAERVHSISEMSNIGSRLAKERIGSKISSSNYLIKALVRNVFSILVGGRECGIYYVLNGHQSYRF